MRGLRELMRGKDRRWWCGAGHSTTQENACTTPVLPNEKFCSQEHMESELKLHERAKQATREIPLLQTRNRIRNDFAQQVADNIAIEAPATWVKCPRCGGSVQLHCESGRVAEIRPEEPAIGRSVPGYRTQITFTYWVTWPLDRCGCWRGANSGQGREGVPGNGSGSATAGDGLRAERGGGDRGVNRAGDHPLDEGGTSGAGWEG